MRRILKAFVLYFIAFVLYFLARIFVFPYITGYEVSLVPALFSSVVFALMFTFLLYALEKLFPGA